MTKSSQTTLGVGIIGCGSISATYLRLAPLFRGIAIKAVADINMAAALTRAEEFGTKAVSVEDLLAAADIDIIVNLTIPSAHAAVTRSILEAGKHVYSEKPAVLSLEEGLELQELAISKGPRIGSAPDTFLGGSHQMARALLDDGELGTVVAGTCHFMSHGMEHWHPNPDFFFQPGGGPMLDLGPYYVTNLIQLLGPVKRVAALATAPQTERLISSEPRAGERIPVKTPTNIHALLDFEHGATVTVTTSWDVWAHRHGHMELYGSRGSLFMPDPNMFGGVLEKADADGAVSPVAMWDHPFSVANDRLDTDPRANYRTAGLADIAQAIRDDRPHRCSFDLALHAVDVMVSVIRSGETGEFVDITTRCERPAPLGPEDARTLLA
ncbi:MAG: Gfo/Idh/MocA family oxidoreductase [Pseudomonadota bacterium]